MLLCLTRVTCSRKKIGQVAVRVRVIRANPDGFSKGRLGAHLSTSRKPHNAQVVVGLGQIRIALESLSNCGHGIRASAQRPVRQTQFVPCQGVPGRN